MESVSERHKFFVWFVERRKFNRMVSRLKGSTIRLVYLNMRRNFFLFVCLNLPRDHYKNRILYIPKNIDLGWTEGL